MIIASNGIQKENGRGRRLADAYSRVDVQSTVQFEYTIEWLASTTTLSSKPTALVIASTSGGKAFEKLELIFRTFETKVVEGSKQLIQGAKREN